MIIKTSHQHQQIKFTNTNLKSLPSNPTNSSSTELIGLKCLPGKTGNNRFLLRYKFNGCKCSITIGRFPDIDINQARKVARKYKGMVADGVDPKAQRDNQVDYPRVRSFFYDTYRHWLSEERKLGLWTKSDSECTVMQLVTLNIRQPCDELYLV